MATVTLVFIPNNLNVAPSLMTRLSNFLQYPGAAVITYKKMALRSHRAGAPQNLQYEVLDMGAALFAGEDDHTTRQSRMS